MRFLFTTHPGSGHWHPLVPLAEAVRAAGHEVAFATTPMGCAAITALGFRCFPAGVDDTDEEARQRREELARLPGSAAAAWAWPNLFAGVWAERRLPDLLAVCREWRPALLVREINEFAGYVAAERLGFPHAAVQITAWRPHLHRLIAPPLNRLRAAVGLAPEPDLASLYQYLMLAPVPRGYQDPAAPLPPTAHVVRPLVFDRSGDEPLPDWVGRLPPRPTVYATLGTVFNRVPGVVGAILAGLREEPITLILTTGRDQDPAGFGPQPPHVHIERYIPQSLLFPRCDLVITHGGSGTVMTALGHGLPMVVIPISADQPDNARRCQQLGVAKVIEPAERTPTAIRDAAREVLGNPAYRQRAERLRAEIDHLPGPEYAVTLLERLAVERRPLVAARAGPPARTPPEDGSDQAPSAKAKDEAPPRRP